jgi:thousand and one amino acid protein kinase
MFVNIAQNDSPMLQAVSNWSDTFRKFVDLCLKKNPIERLASNKLLLHPFITRPKSNHVLMDLISRTKAAVRDLDNLNYRKMKKILMADSCETDSQSGDVDGKHI